MDPDPDPALFVSDLQDTYKKYSFASYFLKIHLHHSSKIKTNKTVEIKVFSYIYCLMMEGSWSGSVPLTNGSRSGRPKNLRIRIRIWNTVVHYLTWKNLLCYSFFSYWLTDCSGLSPTLKIIGERTSCCESWSTFKMWSSWDCQVHVRSTVPNTCRADQPSKCEAPGTAR